MKQALLITFLFFYCPLPVSSQQNQNQSYKVRNLIIEQELIDLEKKLNAAYLKKDIATIKSIMADDIIIIYGNGLRATKAEDIANIGKDEQIESSFQDEFEVRMFGEAAIVMSRITSKVMKGDQKFIRQFRYIDVFEKRAGRWQCIISQNTRISK